MTSHGPDHRPLDSDGMAGMDMGPGQPAAPGTASPAHPAKPPTFGTHNQMMVGKQTIYLSHLPMFMFNPQRHPHNFQVILEVTLSGPGNAQATYVNDRTSHPHERMYTMSPAPFEMIEFDPQHPKRHALTGTIYRGHLERGGQQIIPDPQAVAQAAAVAQVVNIVYFHKFDPHAQPLTQLEYLLFGKAPELFLAHLITRPPDFDQLLAVTISGPPPAADALRRGIRVLIPGRANTPHTRLKAGEQVAAQVPPASTATAPPLALQLEVGTEFYFEEGELGTPQGMTMDQTPEEKAAGF